VPARFEDPRFTYNGGPERWGDDRFYDQWRDQMRRHIVAIAAALR
jgi:hypothetical protein